MADFFEIDFLDVETKKSGDAIALRYEVSGQEYIHVVDGGYLETGKRLISHIQTHYGNPKQIDHVVASHPDGDHTAGLRQVLEDCQVQNLWMNRPWLYADHLLSRFSRYTNRDNLIRDLKAAYPNTTALEEIATRRGIPIHEAFQGASIGAFVVMAPTWDRYIEKVLDSEKTGRVAEVAGTKETSVTGFLAEILAGAVNLVKSAWGGEFFPSGETSAENEMSIVQYAYLSGKKIVLTADTGREGLQELIDFAPRVGLALPGVDRFQVPHHGSRRNVSTELLDQILGQRLEVKLLDGETKFTAIISSAKEDEDHPRKAVVRAMHHRGAKVISTEGRSICTFHPGPLRAGWTTVENMPYPDQLED
ncbi:ComEC/Rec2 family competence protein [Rhizobium leguminosarum]|uniref:ComEC/Rec2 family competence protein n=1 Tax=Rhizobium leguminosarum TaxID=384 RepID=UPI001C901A31|nr:MBL fold metallo-hydrolase [Rhizobium leguminosarum]MBY2997834.1 MBL fold metallo-hydrolase [Rhizobium leguminosarum]